MRKRAVVAEDDDDNVMAAIMQLLRQLDDLSLSPTDSRLAENQFNSQGVPPSSWSVLQ
jgi:hypothetical protein